MRFNKKAIVPILLSLACAVLPIKIVSAQTIYDDYYQKNRSNENQCK